MRHTTLKIVLAGVALLIATTAFAADFPVKAVCIVTPFPPGGGVDLVAACVAYAAWLDQVELRDEARKYWRALAAERPEDSRLKELAAE